MSYTYVYFCPVIGDPIYVGKGQDRRAYEHWEKCENPPKKSNKQLLEYLRKIKAAGLEPRIEIVLDGVTPREALDKEIEIIALYKRKSKGGTLYNLTNGGEGSVGYKAPPEVIEKWSECKSGDKNPMYGKSSSGSKGMTWWNNGIDKILSFDCPEGYVKGMLKTGKPSWNSGKKTGKPSWNSGKKTGPLLKPCGPSGRFWWNNGIEQIMCEECPPGYVKGMLKHRK